MTYGTLPGDYPASSKWLHWLVAICVLTTAVVAVTMVNLVPEGPTQDKLFVFHKSLGVLILILMVLRLINRLVVGAPAPVLERHRHRLELLAEPAHADTEVDPAARQPIDGRDLLRRVDGVPLRHEADPVPRRILFVTAAKNASVLNGSRGPCSPPTGRRPSAEYG